MPLIHDVTLSHQDDFAGWQEWFAAYLPDQSVPNGLKINNCGVVLQSAMDDIQAGRLVQILPELSIPSQLAYYLVYRPESCQNAKIKAFRDWLEIKKENFLKNY